MRKLLFSIFCLFVAFISVAQTSAINSNDHAQPDSSNQIKQWLQEAGALKAKDTAAANKLFAQAILTSRRNKLLKLEGQAGLKYGEFLFRQELYNRSFGHFYRSRDIFANYEKSDSDLAKALLGVGKSQYHRAVYSKASAPLLDAIKLAQKLGEEATEAEASEYLGLVYNAFNNFSMSISYFRHSLHIKTKTEDITGAVNIAARLADIYYGQQQYDSAFYFSSLAYKKAQQQGMRTNMRQAQFTKTAALIRLKKWEQATVELENLSVAGSQTDVDFLVRYRTVAGNYYLAKGDEKKSKSYYDSAFAVAKLNAHPELLSIIYKNMADSYFDKGFYKQAYEFSKLHHKALTDLYGAKSLSELGRMEEFKEVEKSKDEIKLLNAENKVSQLQLLREKEARDGLQKENVLMDSILHQQKNLGDALAKESAYKSQQLAAEKKLLMAESENLKDEKRIRYLLIAGLAVVLLSSVIILFLYKKQTAKGAIIEKQSEDLQTLMKEIHHRVKNNLQIISSLLDLQSHSIKDTHASEAVKEGKNRVQSMALIHQNLYSDGNIKGIKAREYVANLLQSLCDSYNITNDKVVVTTQVDDLNIDVDTMIPIGLVLNELVSNSLKYAFKETRKGELKVILKQEHNHLQLKVSDNGTGFPADMQTAHTKSFGLKMINAFAKKLKAKLSIYNENGAVVEMQIAKYKIA